MGKLHSETKSTEGDTRILYKKSNNTIFTHSRTCSGASQFYTRSGILQIKKTLSPTNQYYVDGDKVKRDLSIETDVCILRRYYKSKRSKQSNQEGVSTKSKYSTVVVTEIDTIEEFQPDESACGDNDRTEVNTKPDLDLTSIMIENLKNLVNKWIQKHLLDNKDTKQKIDTVLDSILHKFELNRPSVNHLSSCSTYVLNKDGPSQVKNKRIETLISCQYSKQKYQSTGVETPSNVVSKDSSYHSMPFPYKNLRIISTLSIPRNIHKHKSGKKKINSMYKLMKVKHKDVLFSVNRPSKLMVDSSSFDLLAISTKSLTKRCATYDMYTKKKKHNRKRRILFVPKPDYKSVTDTTITIGNDHNLTHLDAMPSLVKSIFAGDPTNITSTEKAVYHVQRNDNCTNTEVKTSQEIATSITLVQETTSRKSHEVNFEYMTNNNSIVIMNEHDQSRPILSFDFYNRSLEFPSIIKPHNSTFAACKCKSNGHITKIVKKVKVSKHRRACPRTKINSQLKYQNIKNKNFTYLYKKVGTNQGIDFFKHSQNIFKYFAEYETNKNIRLDIHVNVVPMFENELKNECTEICSESLNKYVVESSSNHVSEQNRTVIYNVKPSTTIPMLEKFKEGPLTEKTNLLKSEYDIGIIPLLDGAKSNDVFKEISVETIKENTELLKKVSDRSTTTCDFGITQELSELKTVIRDLASTAEKFVAEHQRYSKTSYSETTHSQNNNKSKGSTTINTEPPSVTKKLSKAVQFSSNFAKNQYQSGLKLTKEPKKKDPVEFHNRLTKKSTSYHIIESESILKVTDMTSANEVNSYKFMDEALTCSLPKSKSLFEIISDNNKRKLLAFFCNECNNANVTNDCNYSVSSHTTPVLKKWVSKCFDKSKVEKSVSEQSPNSENCSKSNPLNVDIVCSEKCSNNKCDDNYSTSIYIEDEDNDLKLSVCHKQHGMHFGEGFVYCVLMLIPLTIIAFLFYDYVIKNVWSAPYSDNTNNKSYLKITDLGF